MEKEYLEKLLETNSIRSISKITGNGFSTIRYWVSKYELKSNFGKERKGICRTCNKSITEEEEYKHTRGIFKKCFTNNVIENIRLFKIACLEYKGSKCIKCGYDKCNSAMEFHHRDPERKDFEVSKYRTRGKNLGQKVKDELDKCDLLCCRCHREIHEEIELSKI